MQRDPEQERTLQMATDIVIPSDLWEEDEETVITGWLADDGATVEEGESRCMVRVRARKEELLRH